MDSGEFQIRPVECPDCGAPFPWDKPRCWLCGWKLGDPVTPGKKEKFRPKIIVEDDGEADLVLTRTFSLSTIFLWMTLLAVVLGAILIAPGLGIALAVVSLPAALRTVISVQRRERKKGQMLSVWGRIALFLGWSVAVAVAAAAAGIAFAVAAFLAFLADCLNLLSNHAATTPPSPGFGGIAAVVALIVGGLLLWAFWQIGD